MEERKRRRLTAKRKFEIYLETKKDGAKVGEMLRREGSPLNDLRTIEEQVERGAVGALKMKEPGRGIRKKIDLVEYDQLKRELKEKEKAMSDLMVEWPRHVSCSLAHFLRPNVRSGTGLKWFHQPDQDFIWV